MHDPHRDNVVRFETTHTAGHVESHFLRANSPDGQRALWVKHTLLVPRGRAHLGVAEVWAVAFDRAAGLPGGAPHIGAKTTVPMGEARWQREPFGIETAGARFGAEAWAGEAESGGHRLRWTLSLENGGAPPFHPFPLEKMYEAPFPKSKALTPYPFLRVSGSLEVDGARWRLDGWPGMQGHNWGRSHAEAYAWGQCNAFDGEAPGAAWFEGLSGRVKVGPATTPWLSVAAVHVDGETHRFDGARAMTSRAAAVGWYVWDVILRKGETSLRVRVSAERDELAGLHYENPDGAMTYCLNSKLARGEVVLVRPGRPERRLSSDKFALELGTKDPKHGVPMAV